MNLATFRHFDKTDTFEPVWVGVCPKMTVFIRYFRVLSPSKPAVIQPFLVKTRICHKKTRNFMKSGVFDSFNFQLWAKQQGGDCFDKHGFMEKHGFIDKTVFLRGDSWRCFDENVENVINGVTNGVIERTGLSVLPKMTLFQLVWPKG